MGKNKEKSSGFVLLNLRFGSRSDAAKGMVNPYAAI